MRQKVIFIHICWENLWVEKDWQQKTVFENDFFGLWRIYPTFQPDRFDTSLFSSEEPRTNRVDKKILDSLSIPL